MIQIDGSHGEGGGSILRQALALSILTGKDFSIRNIRASRSPSGLAPQHLASLNAAAAICKATLWGNSLGSTEVYFKPGQLSGSQVKIDVGTAGSTTLLLQSMLLPCVFSGRRMAMTATGGTDVAHAAPFDYFRNVFLPQVRRYADADASLFRRGYYPKGGGEIKVTVSSRVRLDSYLNPIILSGKPSLLQVRGVSHASSDLEASQVSERQAEAARLALKVLGVPVNISSQYYASESTGSGITLWGVFGEDEIDFDNPVMIGADALGERGKKAEIVGEEAAKRLIAAVGVQACTDEFLADQLIPYLGVAGGVVQVPKVTGHVLSNIYVTEKFLGCKFVVDGNVISCSRQIDGDAGA